MSSVPRESAETFSELAVLVPVFGASRELERCLASLSRHWGGTTRLILDGPQPPDVEAVVRAFEDCSRSWVGALRLPTRRGFAAAANAGIAACRGDVVLLNSDTEVTSGWLEKLHQATHSAPDIATATPFSNSATICSLPRWLAENALPTGHTPDSFGRLVEERSLRERPAIPTGVGFCMYLRRAALDQAGPFDERGFGLGYGEEVDWCFRAAGLGWRHVLDDATFVFHTGQASFGTGRGPWVRRRNRAIRRRYPGQWRSLGEFVRADPLSTVRRRVVEALRPARAHSSRPVRRVLHVVHGWPPWNHAGTELYAARLARWQAARRPTSALARIAHPGRELGDVIEMDDHGVRVQLVVNNFRQRSPLSRAAIREPAFERIFLRLVEEERPALVHVHHLAGLCSTLPRLARARGLPVVYQVQDWWTPCARVNLLDCRRRSCTGPGLRKCSRCLPLTRHLPPAVNLLLHLWRRRALRRALRSADAWIMGSRFIASSYRELALLPEGSAHILPYGFDREPGAPRSPRRGPLRVGMIGSLLPHKGAHVAVQAFAGVSPELARLEIWGAADDASLYARELRVQAGDSVVFRGAFPEGEEGRVFGEIDVLVVPSLGLESYGLAPREALAHGVYVLLSGRGALGELLGDRRFAAGFDPERPDELRSLVLGLASDRSWQRGVRAGCAQAPTLAEHAAAVERVYEQVLAGR